MTDGGLLIVAEDVTECAPLRAQDRHMAMFDSLTGLPNRFQFRDKIQEAADQLVETGGFIVLYIDLDRFKEVNDTLGHPIGDKLLGQVAQRLGHLQRGNMVARFGGDEFVVLLDRSCSFPARHALQKPHRTLSAPYRVDDHMIIIGASIGTATPRMMAATPTTSSRADMALYHAKAKAAAPSAFHLSMDEKAREQPRDRK